ncbi:putative tetratricopeptide-like helical domain superfamily [Helianthus annuus]|nr:putative tetratricopeptide-like helical domain superfamily [Helianthus annuus]
MKKLRNEAPLQHGKTQSDLFESLHDDIVIFILCKLSSTASSPSDFIAVLHTCKRLNKLGLHPFVLSKSCSKALAVRAKNWYEEAHKFLKLCVDASNTEAYYILGMDVIRSNRSYQRFDVWSGSENKGRKQWLWTCGSGASLMAKAAVKSHAPALYSLALLKFNGSGGLKNNKDLRAGVALCARAACLGHPDALRELAHCLQDGYGIRRNIAEGHRLLVQANSREFTSVLRVLENKPTHINFDYELLNDYGFNQASRQMHPVNKFMVDGSGQRKMVSRAKV